NSHGGPSPSSVPGAALPTVAEPEAPNPAVWESLDTDEDTETVARGDTDRGRPKPPTPGSRRESPAPWRPQILPYSLGAVALLGLVAGGYFAFFNKTNPPPTPPEQNPSGKWIVSETSGPNHVQTLRKALEQAAAGDTIVIAKNRLTESRL